MTLFGEFLVEKNIISREQLLKALVFQFKNIPTVAEIIYNHQLLKVDEMLLVFKKQVELQCSFIEAAKTLNYWNKLLQNSIENKLTGHKTPLGEVLINLQIIDVEQMTKSLDEYLSMKNEKKESKITVQNESINLVSIKRNEEDQEFLLNLNKLTDELVFNDQKECVYSSIKNHPQIWDAVIKYLTNKVDAHSLKHYPDLVNCLKEIEKCNLENLGRDLSSFLKDFYQVYSSYLKELSQFYHLQKSNNSMSLRDYLKNEKYVELLTKLDDKMILLKFELGISL